MARNYQQGRFIPKNPEKYKGDHTKITYRSSYELEFFKWADRREAVLEWSSETIIVPYYDPVRGKKRRYMVDVWMKCRDKHGEVHTFLGEIKPMSQVVEPKQSSRKKKSTIIEEQTTWLTNQAKWQAAEKYAKDRGWKWIILTEKHIFG